MSDDDTEKELTDVLMQIMQTRRAALESALDMLDHCYDDDGELTDAWALAEQMAQMAVEFFRIEQQIRDARSIDDVTQAVGRWSGWLDLAVVSCQRVARTDEDT